MSPRRPDPGAFPMIRGREDRQGRRKLPRPCASTYSENTLPRQKEDRPWAVFSLAEMERFELSIPF